MVIKDGVNRMGCNYECEQQSLLCVSHCVYVEARVEVQVVVSEYNVLLFILHPILFTPSLYHHLDHNLHSFIT